MKLKEMRIGFAMAGTPACDDEAVAKMGTRFMGLDRDDPFGGVRWLLVGDDDYGVEKTREFWLMLGVIGGALILMSSAMAAFSG
jgi:hypothetical protein